MEGLEKKEGFEREEIFSKAVRAGKRTYFFDVKATRRNDYYLTITESKKRFDQEGHFHFEKHKLFLYKEDFDKFAEGLNEVVEFIKKANNKIDYKEEENGIIEELKTEMNFTDVSFEDLDQ